MTPSSFCDGHFTYRSAGGSVRRLTWYYEGFQFFSLKKDW
jgi:hypothetical protein